MVKAGLDTGKSGFNNRHFTQIVHFALPKVQTQGGMRVERFRISQPSQSVRRSPFRLKWS